MSEKNENVEQEVTEEIKKINEEKSELQKKQKAKQLQRLKQNPKGK